MGMQRSASQLDGRNLMKAPKMEPRQKSCDDFIRNSKGRNSVQKPARRQMVTSQRKLMSNFSNSLTLSILFVYIFICIDVFVRACAFLLAYNLCVCVCTCAWL